MIGRADQFVETSPELANLSRRLLGRCWFVDTLQSAVRLAGNIGRGLSFVTVAGEVLGADGTLLVGPRQSTTGLLSRRSELRALHDEIRETEQQHAQHLRQCKELEEVIAQAEQTTQQLAGEHAEMNKQLGKVQLRASAAEDRLDQCHRRMAELEQKRDSAREQIQSAAVEAKRSEAELQACQESLARLETSLLTGAGQSDQLERRTSALQRTAADLRVALARSEQRRDGLRRQMEALRRDHDERDRALADTRDRVAECRSQRADLQTSILALTTELAELYRTLDTVAVETQRLQAEYTDLRKGRQSRLQAVEELRTESLARQRQLGQLQLQSQQLTHERSALAERMQEDYQINLAEVAGTTRIEDLDERDATDEEIRELRRQLQQIGPVNLESLSELENIEDRYNQLAQQHEDLQKSKAQLKRLIERIDTESNELFVSTIDVIREHFRQLYRSLFGGGEANIVIEAGEDEDALESGIEIIARPPGKQLRSISLLSGGERTMTCVALLLAIFRSRPSPFCILDEVDAALDEANIDRFTEVIREFMKTTQFVVVTHSKRTMACADTLYGVTMQESGISKRVSVRLEDVEADGHIRTAA